MAKVQGAVVINEERCKGCNLCVMACPADVLALQSKEVNNRGYHFAYMANEQACIGCSSCAVVCPDGCIEVYRVVKINDQSWYRINYERRYKIDERQ